MTKEEVIVDSDFVSLLNHKTRIIQVQRLGEKRRSKLEQFLLLFNQGWAVKDTRYIIDLKEIPTSFSDIADYLKGPVADEAFRRQLEAEQEIDDIFRQQEIDLKLARQQKEAALKAKEAALKAEEVALKAEEAALKAQEAAFKAKEVALKAQEVAQQRELAAKQEAKSAKQEAKSAKQEAKSAKQEAKSAKQEAKKNKINLLKLADYLINQNTPLTEIEQLTGLSKTEILKLKK